MVTTYQAKFGNTIKLSIVIILSLSIVLFIKIRTLYHPLYLIIVGLSFCYALYSYLKTKIKEVVIDGNTGSIKLIQTRLLGKEKVIEFELKNFSYELIERTGSKGGKYQELSIRRKGEIIKLRGEQNGWTNATINKIFDKLESLKNVNQPP